MKKVLYVFLALILVAGLVFLPRLLSEKPEEIITETEQEASTEEEAVQTEPEPVLVSDPIYGDELTEEELETLRQEDLPDEETPTIIIGEEFVIEMDENQGTGGF